MPMMPGAYPTVMGPGLNQPAGAAPSAPALLAPRTLSGGGLNLKVNLPGRGQIIFKVGQRR